MKRIRRGKERGKKEYEKGRKGEKEEREEGGMKGGGSECKKHK